MTFVREGARHTPDPDLGLLHLPPDSSAPRVARHHVHRLLRDQAGRADVVDAAVLLTSELVSNAVLHGRAPVAVNVTRHAGGVRVEVRDAGSSFPAVRRRQWDATAEGGRGLQLLSALASSWGSTTHDRPLGKTVWFELADPPLAGPPG